ncbi:hypothetical protein F4679DRAFT_249734 [Xylaria curta]|nr:hypothetical protein F4679DRAFT_249734 [Xylaria curta]
MSPDEIGNMNPVTGTTLASSKFIDAGGRPRAPKQPDPPKFRPGDQVYLLNAETSSWDGPFTVACPHQDHKYKLQDMHGQEVSGGKLFEEKELKRFNPFE